MEADEMNETCFDKNDDVSLRMHVTHAEENIFNMEVL